MPRADGGSRPLQRPADPGSLRRVRGRIPTLGAPAEELPRLHRRSQRCRRQAELLVLPDICIKANSHMLMQDDNNLDIADLLLAWIDKNVVIQ